MSRTFRGLAAGAAAVLAFTGISVAASGTAIADEDDCLQVLDHAHYDTDNGNNGNNGNNGENGDDEDDNAYEDACENGADGDFEQCLTQLMFDGGVGAVTATDACTAAQEDEDEDDEDVQQVQS